MPPLLDLPLELLVAISSFLSTPDLGALRLTCREVEKSLYEWFSKEFFTKKQFMLTYKSLQAFLEISRHSSFSKKLSHVIIATDVYMNNADYLPFRDKESGARYTQGYSDQVTLLNTGIDREMLAEAFANLENLQTVGIRDFNNHERSRDGISWHSWGAPTIYRETGVEIQFTTNSRHGPTGDTNFLARVFQSLVYALGKANQTPTELEVLLRHHALPDSAFVVPDFLLPSVGPVLAGLKKLLLRADTTWAQSFTHGINRVPESLSSRSLRFFLGLTKNLEHLRLNLPKHMTQSNEQLLKWLALPAPTSTPEPDYLQPPPVSLSCLTQLELGQFSTFPIMIRDVVQKFTPTLRRLELWKLILMDDPFPSVLNFVPNQWSNLFEKLSKMPNLQLDHLKVGMLSQSGMHVQFTNHDTKTGRPGLKVKTHTGSKMGEFLRELTNDVFVLWPEPMSPGDQSSDDDDESMDVDEDEDGDEGEDDDDNDDGSDDA